MHTCTVGRTVLTCMESEHVVVIRVEFFRRHWFRLQPESWQCVDEGMYDMVPQVTVWLAVFVIDRLRPWIARHGGWNGKTMTMKTCPDIESYGP